MTPEELHRWARPLVLRGLEAQDIVNEPLGIAQAVQGIGWLETRYSTAWRGAGRGSNNMGADQSGRPPCDDNGFLYTDTHPNPDGTSTPYSICFRKYATPESGFSGLVRIAYLRRPKVLDAARAGDFYRVSSELHASHYYEGFGKTVADRIANHFKALSSAIAAQVAALDELAPTHPAIPEPEPWQDERLDDNPLIMRGSRGRYVHVWQRILSDWLSEHEMAPIACDGVFGKHTEADTKVLQIAWHLKPDGKVGQRTWEAAEAAA
jgi:peptidoglycan hydrolase-like protein with peptidoglycan-binding domain